MWASRWQGNNSNIATFTVSVYRQITGLRGILGLCTDKCVQIFLNLNVHPFIIIHNVDIHTDVLKFKVDVQQFNAFSLMFTHVIQKLFFNHFCHYLRLRREIELIPNDEI